MDFSIADNSHCLGNDMEGNRNVEIRAKQAASMVHRNSDFKHSRNTSNYLYSLLSEKKEKIKIFKDKPFSRNMSDVHEMQKSLTRLQQDTEQISSIFAKLVNGKPGYKAVVEMKKEPIKCTKCNYVLEGMEKFCPECGEKTNFKK